MELEEKVKEDPLKLIKRHIKQVYTSTVLYSGLLTDKNCPSCFNREPFNEFANTFGKEKTFYLTSDDEVYLATIKDQKVICRSYDL